jgi:Ca2+-binding RTX toxin-like protein
MVAMSVVGAAPASAAAECQGESATIVGTRGSDSVRGTDGRDVIAGLSGADRIFGAGGDDVICGNAGADDIRGNGGDDTLHGNNGDDTVWGNSGHDLVHGNHGSDIVAGGWGADHVDGGLGYLFRKDGGPRVKHDLLRGGPGDDRLVPGKDRRDHGMGWDQISYVNAKGPVQVDATLRIVTGDGTDTYPADVKLEIVGSPFGDEMLGSPGDDRFTGGNGADLLVGNYGSDHLIGNGGADEIRGNAGIDGIEGGTGRDRLLGGTDADVIIDDGKGPDWINAQGGEDYVGDHINWGDGHVVKGGSGRDYIYLQSDQTGPDARRPGRTDLRSGRTVVFERPRIHATVVGFEKIALPKAPWTIYGSSAGETVFSASFLGGQPRFALDARMGGGNDKIYGTVKNDVFFGGSGYDTVHDYGGVDVCRSIEVKLGHGKIPCDH